MQTFRKRRTGLSATAGLSCYTVASSGGTCLAGQIITRTVRWSTRTSPARRSSRIACRWCAGWTGGLTSCGTRVISNPHQLRCHVVDACAVSGDVHVDARHAMIVDLLSTAILQLLTDVQQTNHMFFGTGSGFLTHDPTRPDPTRSVVQMTSNPERRHRDVTRTIST